MSNGKTSRSFLGKAPEVWLTPLLGVLGFCLYSLHDHLSLWHSLGDKFVFALFMSAPLFMVSGLLLHFLKATPLSAPIRVLMLAVLSGGFTGWFYFYLATHYFELFQTCPPNDWESCGDISTIWAGEADMAGVITAMATLLASFVAWLVTRDQNKLAHSPSLRA